MTISNHFQNDRADRYAFIATTMGLGRVMHTYMQPFNKNRPGAEPCHVEITSTGIAIVKSPDDAIVTMYVLTIGEAQKYFDNIPMFLEAVIRTNMKRKYHILQNTIKY